MPRAFRHCLALFVTLALSVPCFAADAPASAEPDKAAELIRQLGHRSFKVREQAAKDFAAVEKKLLATGHRFDWSAMISVRERPDAYKSAVKHMASHAATPGAKTAIRSGRAHGSCCIMSSGCCSMCPACCEQKSCAKGCCNLSACATRPDCCK